MNLSLLIFNLNLHIYENFWENFKQSSLVNFLVKTCINYTEYYKSISLNPS